MNTACTVITTPSIRECCDFYARALDAAIVERSEGYARLRFRGCELAFVLPHTQRRLPMFQHTAPTRGLSITVESSNLLNEYDDLIRRGLAPLGPLREFEGGQRSFAVIDPAGTVINFIEPRPQPLF
jgi:catechol 2,3-dioxygenase-like lactoylglutathione lyase family enzyme